MKNLFLALLLLSHFQTLAANSASVFENIDHQLILAGETHTHDQLRAEFSEDLEIFANNGGEVLALEMVETIYQDLLERYLEDKKNSEQDLYDYLKYRWGYNTDSYMKMITRAKELGLDLLAVDLPKAQRPQEVLIFPVPPDVSLVRAAREAHMAKVLCQEERKTVLIIGSFHILERFLPAALKKECFKKSYQFKL